MNKNTPYGLIGDGRLANHLSHYFSLKKIPYQTWSRKKDTISLSEKLKDCDVLLVAIKDNAIENLIQSQNLPDKKWIHFSGSLSTKLAQGFHPLASFGESLYDLSFYEKIPFVVEKGKYLFKDIFPHLKNNSYEISSQDKSLYHSLCVLSGNFTAILWQKTLSEMSHKLSLPKEALTPYMDSVFKQLSIDPQKALTGPLVRGDQQTIEKNLFALKGDPFEGVYKSFVTAYQKSKEYQNNECA